MTAADLERLDELAAKTKKLRTELNRLRNAPEVSAVNYSGAGAGSGTGDCVSRVVLSVMDVEDKIRRAQAAMLDIIDTISSTKTRKIFRRKYVDGWSCSRIADDLGYLDERSVRRRIRRYINGVKNTG